MQHVYPGYFPMKKSIPYFKLVSDQRNQLKIAKKMAVENYQILTKNV